MTDPLNLIEITEQHLGKNKAPLGSCEVTYSIPEGTDPDSEKARLGRYLAIAEQAPERTRYFIAGELTGPSRGPTQRTLTATYYR